jgi:hypothetical protein
MIDIPIAFMLKLNLSRALHLILRTP